MSLKAKIEAVIYAAEEPVTLAQLMSLLGQEAQAELDRLEERQGQLELEPSSDGTKDGAPDSIPLPSEPDLLNAEILAIEDEATDIGEPIDTGEPMEGTGAGGAGAVIDTDPADGPEPKKRMGDAEGETEPGRERRLEIAGDQDSGRVAPGVAVASASAERERDRQVRAHLREVVSELVRSYAEGDRGLEIREVAGGFRFATKPEYHDAVRGFVRALKPPLKLSLQALETLAVVAYKQPVTSPEISEIRGVDSAGVLGSLMARKLVTTAGRKQVIGRPILYKTTKDFLLRFGLKDTSELPSIEEFEKLAGELAEPEDTTMIMTSADLGAESAHTDTEMARASGSFAAGIASDAPGTHTGVESPGTSPPGGDVIGSGGEGGPLDEAPAPSIPSTPAHVTEPQADGDSSPADEVTVDGRLSGIGAAGTGEVPADPSPDDAMIQRDADRDA